MVDYIEDSNSGKSQSQILSVYSFSEIACIEESNLELMVEERPLCDYQTHISPEYLQEHIKLYLFMDDEKYEQQ